MTPEIDPLTSIVASAKSHSGPSADAAEHAWGRLEGSIAAGVAPVADAAIPDVTAPLAKGLAGAGMGKTFIAGALAVIGASAVGVALSGPATDGPPRLEPTAVAAAHTGEAQGAAAIAEQNVDDVDDEEEPSAVLAPEVRASDDSSADTAPPSTRPAEQGDRASTTPRRKKRGARTPTPPSSGASRLSIEAQLLGEARARLGNNDPKGALALVAQHRRRFPKTQLKKERRACELVARCQQGKASAGRKASEFLSQNSGVLARWVTEACRESLPGRAR